MKQSITNFIAKRDELKKQASTILDLAEKEERPLTAEDKEKLDGLKEQIANWDTTIKEFADMSEPVTEPVNKTDAPKNTVGKFASFGEQLKAVYNAAQPTEKVIDTRLLNTASGASEVVPTDGGFLVQTDFSDELLKVVYETGILAPRCRKIPISSGANGIKINAVDSNSRANGARWGGIQAYWIGEADEITATKPKFRQMELNLQKLTGACYATDELLQDAAALESVIMQAFSEEFGFKLDDAIVNGSGTGEPLGILESSAMAIVPKETAQDVPLVTDNITKMWARCWGRSRQNAVWFINQELEPYLYTLKIGDTPIYVPAGGLSAQPFATLMGRPIIPLEQCAAKGAKGDIVLADLSQYLLIDKGGIQNASSIHVRFLYDESVFRFIYRVDGQPVWNAPLTPFKGADTLSPFVTLAGGRS